MRKRGSVTECQNIAVGVRIRPFTEKDDNTPSPWRIQDGTTIVQVPREGCDGRKDKNTRGVVEIFDHVFGPETGTEAVYDCMCESIVDGLLDGYNGTMFAYGQVIQGYLFSKQSWAASFL